MAKDSENVFLYESNDKSIPERFKLKPIKTHAEFLEELKETIKEQKVFGEYPATGFMAYIVDADDIIDIIEQFEAQLAQGDKNE